MAKAAVTRRIRDDHQKNFLKIFNSLTGKHSRWEIWEDFVTLTAIEISNSTDKVNAPERTKMYQTIVSKYSAKEWDGMVEMLAEVIMGMEQNPDQDFLGSLYMMCELGNDHAGQFFTPYDVCRCMAEITFDPKLHPDMEGFISVSDPACGAGATLLAFLNVCKRRNICYHNKVLVIAQDIDFIVGLMCYIMVLTSAAPTPPWQPRTPQPAASPLSSVRHRCPRQLAPLQPLAPLYCAPATSKQRNSWVMTTTGQSSPFAR